MPQVVETADERQFSLARRKSEIRPYRLTARTWLVVANVLGSLHVIFGLGATIVTSLVAAQPPLLGVHPELLVANLKWAAVALTAVSAFLNTTDRGRKYRAAQRHLMDAIVKFDSDPSYTLNQLILARWKAAELLDNNKPLPE